MTHAQRQTERHMAELEGLDSWNEDRILECLVAGQERAVAAVRAASPRIAEAANLVADRLRAGGRLVYAGAGTSIRVGVQDGSELPATFGLAEDRIVYLIAGGRAAMFETLAAAEDDGKAGARAAAACTAADVMIAIAASGQTPYTLAAARAARSRGAAVIAIFNNRASPLAATADVAIELDSGPEVIVGSTRMGAGTAQKACLNLLSTLANIRLGAVHDGYMVNMQPDNAKLRQRARDIVMAVARTEAERAEAALAAAGGAIKPAVLLCAGAADLATAQELLGQSGGNLRQALARLAG
jgi:N-acetylmuramic acid 6-phosphate etherase